MVNRSDLLDEGLLDSSNFVKLAYGLGNISLSFNIGKTNGTYTCRMSGWARRTYSVCG